MIEDEVNVLDMKKNDLISTINALREENEHLRRTMRSSSDKGDMLPGGDPTSDDDEEVPNQMQLVAKTWNDVFISVDNLPRDTDKLRTLDSLLQQRPQSTKAIRKRGHLRLHMGKLNGAREDFALAQSLDYDSDTECALREVCKNVRCGHKEVRDGGVDQEKNNEQSVDGPSFPFDMPKDMDSIHEALKNPQIMQGIQDLLSNPEAIASLAKSNMFSSMKN
jgi:hypothetical protein